MLARPVLQFNISKIRENGIRIKAICDEHGIEPLFVTKGFCAATEIVSLMKDAGIRYFGDSRIQNIIKIKESLPDIRYLLIRTPSPMEAGELVRYVDASIESSAITVEAISKEAVRQGKTHDVYVNIDVGDLRDGLFSRDQLDSFMDSVVKLPGINITGVFANVGCYGSILPDEKNTAYLVSIKDYINEKYNLSLKTVSFGGTVALPMIMDGRMPKGVNQLRFGEAALFGTDTSGNNVFKDLSQGGVVFSAPVLEVLQKPSVPVGTRGRDALGRVNEYPDRGIRTRAIISAGKQDVDINALVPEDSNIIILGCSSDHIILDVHDCEIQPRVGDYIPFRCNYMAMLAASTSSFVKKEYILTRR